MAFYVYIARCSDGSFYTGHTDDLPRRIAQHNAGYIQGYAHHRRPVTHVFSENFPKRIDALERERQIEGRSRRKKEALIAGDWEMIRRLSTTYGWSSERVALRLVVNLTDHDNTEN